MYAYNAYLLAILGKKAEILHYRLYKCKRSHDHNLNSAMKKYVISNRFVTLLAYGVPLGCFLAIPFASISFSCVIYCIESNIKSLFYYHILPVIILWIYYSLMFIMIVAITKDYFVIKKIQNHN